MKNEQPDELTHIRRLVTLVRSSLGRKFQTSDYLPDRFDDENMPPVRAVITDACAEFMEHQRTMHEWAEKAEKALKALETPSTMREISSLEATENCPQCERETKVTYFKSWSRNIDCKGCGFHDFHGILGEPPYKQIEGERK